MRRLSALFYLLLVSAFIAGCDSPPQPLRLGTNVWPGYEPLYLARELGALPEEDVRLVELPSATDVMHAISMGHIEAGALTLDEVLTLMAEGEDLVVILVFDISDGADVLMARDDIGSLSDLKGKHIASETTALGALMLQAALEAAGLTAEDVHIVHAPLNTHLKEWRKQEIDAAVTFEPYATELEKAGAVRLFDSSAIKGQIVDVLAVQRNVLRSHQQQINKLISAYFSARAHMESNPSDALQIMNQRLKMPAADAAHMFDGLDLPGRQTNLAMLSGSPSELENSAQQLVSVMTRYELLPRHLFVNGIGDPRFLERRP